MVVISIIFSGFTIFLFVEWCPTAEVYIAKSVLGQSNTEQTANKSQDSSMYPHHHHHLPPQRQTSGSVITTRCFHWLIFHKQLNDTVTKQTQRGLCNHYKIRYTSILSIVLVDFKILHPCANQDSHRRGWCTRSEQWLAGSHVLPPGWGKSVLDVHVCACVPAAACRLEETGGRRYWRCWTAGVRRAKRIVPGAPVPLGRSSLWLASREKAGVPCLLCSPFPRAPLVAQVDLIKWTGMAHCWSRFPALIKRDLTLQWARIQSSAD